MTWVKVKDRLPQFGDKVLCRLRHVSDGEIQEHDLIRVDESDCDWRTAGDLCELSYSWDVVEWLSASSD